MTLNANGEEKNPFLRANSLQELLDWHDADFIRCAYVTLLGRQPDRAGERDYLNRLRSGRSRLEILWQIRRSAEGRGFDPGIAGLDRKLRRASWARHPILGWFVRPFLRSAESDSKQDRQFRALLNIVAQTRIDAAGRGRAATTHTAATQPSDDSFKNDQCYSDLRKKNDTISAPELEHLAINAPLQRYFFERASK